MDKLLLERLLAAGVDQDTAAEIVAKVAAERASAEQAARAQGAEDLHEAQQLDRMCEEYDHMYGDYEEQEAGVTCFGKGTLYTNEDGEPTGWC